MSSASASLDTADTLKVRDGFCLPGGLNPGAPSGIDGNILPPATAGVGSSDPDENFDYFKALMESNVPPPGIGATNKDWDATPLEGWW